MMGTVGWAKRSVPTDACRVGTARSAPLPTLRFPPSGCARSAMRVGPIELARLAVERPRLQRALIDAGHRRELGIVAGREDLVGALEIRIAEGLLDDRHAGVAQERDHALAGDAVGEGPLGGRRPNDPGAPP